MDLFWQFIAVCMPFTVIGSAVPWTNRKKSKNKNVGWVFSLQNCLVTTEQFRAKINKIYEAREFFGKELFTYHSSLKEKLEAKKQSVRVESLIENCKGVFETLISKNEALPNIAKTRQDPSKHLIDLKA